MTSRWKATLLCGTLTVILVLLALARPAITVVLAAVGVLAAAVLAWGVARYVLVLRRRRADSHQQLRDIFGDVRMLCDEVGLMNPLARLMWHICRIDGRPSRYRGQPQRVGLPTPTAAATDYRRD